MKFLALSFIAALTAAVVAKPVSPSSSAIHGHKLQPAAVNGTNISVSKAKSLAAQQLDSNTAFSTNGPKFVTYIDNTVSSNYKQFVEVI